MTKTIPLSQDKVALVDDEDYDKLIVRKWIAQQHTKTWYVVASGNPWLSMHRLIMDCPSDKQVDHINHDGLDNRKENLRIVTNSVNQHNRRGVKGYQFIGYRNKWKATIMVNYKQMHLGYFDTEEEASAAYQQAKQKYVFGAQDVEGEDDDE